MCEGWMVLIDLLKNSQFVITGRLNVLKGIFEEKQKHKFEKEMFNAF